MNVRGQKFQSLYALMGNHWHGGTIGRHSLSQPLRAASSLREGAGERSHSTGCSLISGVSGDFHRPYETLNVSHFPIHRTTLPQSRPLGVTAPSEREPGWLSPFNRVLAEIRGYGRFSSFLRKRYNSPWSQSPSKKIEKSGRGWYNQEGSIKKIQRGNVHVLY